MKIINIFLITFIILTNVNCGSSQKDTDEIFNQKLKRCQDLNFKGEMENDTAIKKKCLKCFKILMDSFPEKPELYFELSHIYTNNELCDSALIILNQGLKVDSKNFPLLMQRSLVQLSLDIKVKEEDLQKLLIIAKNTNNIDYYKSLVMLNILIYDKKTGIRLVSEFDISEQSEHEILDFINQNYNIETNLYCGKKIVKQYQ